MYNPKDISNFKRNVRKVNQLAEEDPVAACFKRIKEGDLKEIWISEQRQDVHGRLTHAFLMPKSAVNLARVFGDVQVSDSTFQTNKHGFPLLDICVLDSQYKTVTVAFALLKKDEVSEEDYVWILTAYRQVVFSDVATLPRVWVVDRELAFMKAVQEVFPDVYIIICFWHVEKAIEGHLKSTRLTPRITKDEW